jgi:hypothetical protein
VISGNDYSHKCKWKAALGHSDEGHYHGHPDMKTQFVLSHLAQLLIEKFMDKIDKLCSPFSSSSWEILRIIHRDLSFEWLHLICLVKADIEEVASTSNVPRSKIQDPRIKTV